MFVYKSYIKNILFYIFKYLFYTTNLNYSFINLCKRLKSNSYILVTNNYRYLYKFKYSINLNVLSKYALAEYTKQ